MQMAFVFFAVSNVNICYTMDNAYFITYNTKGLPEVEWNASYKKKTLEKINHLAYRIYQIENEGKTLTKANNDNDISLGQTSIWQGAPWAHRIAQGAGALGGILSFTCICPSAIPFLAPFGIKIGLGTGMAALTGAAVYNIKKDISKRDQVILKESLVSNDDGSFTTQPIWSRRYELIQDIISPIVKTGIVTCGLGLFGLMAYQLRKSNATFMPIKL
jgi:hypothetical protein